MIKFRFSLSILTFTALAINIQNTLAQTYIPSNRSPVADSTMNTQVGGGGNNFNIAGGVSKGQTLFHSFTDFSVPTNGSANFINPVTTRDIITRVTGTNFSDINGLINSNGANFFLINPNGVTFGTNARLNVGKAFMATSANSIDLVDGSGRTITFGTNGAGDAPLLSIAPNVLFDVSRLTMGGNNGQINNFGTLQTTNTSQYIGLIGGNVNLDGGKIFAPGGRVDLGGLNGAGTVTATSTGLDLGGSSRSNVTLSNGAAVSVRANGTLENVQTFFGNVSAPGSSINISANNIDILNSGFKSNTEPAALDAGLEQNSGTYSVTSGDISINATGKVSLDNSYVKNTLRAGTTGNIGGINIIANGVEIKNDGLLATTIAGRGNAGNIKIESSGDLTLTNKSSIFADNDKGTGDAGNIEIKTAGNITVIGTNDLADLAIIDGEPSSTLSVISTQTRGKGNSGKIMLDAQGDISFSNRTFLSSAILETGEGNSQGIEIKNARNLTLTNQSGISSSNAGGTGNAGDIDIKISGNLNITAIPDLTFQNNPASRFLLSGIVSGTKGKGDAGKITIATPGDINLNNSGFISSEIRGAATRSNNSRGIEIKNARDIFLNNNGRIETINVNGAGNTGKIDIKNIRNLIVANQSSISSNIGKDSIGNAGSINIQATGNIKIVGIDPQSSLLPLTSDAISSGLNSFSFGNGNAGNISIDTTGNIEIANRGVIFTTIAPSARGNGGKIEIKNTGNLKLVNGSIISSTNLGGKGDAGNIDIKTGGTIDIIGFDPQSQFARAYPNLFDPLDSSAISAASNGDGKAADISISSDRLNLNKGLIVSSGTSVSGGDITFVISELLLLKNNSFISTFSQSDRPDSNGGNMTIDSPLIVAISPTSGIATNAVGGNGGRVSISSQGLFGIQFVPKEKQSSFTGNFISSSSTFGRDGEINIDTPGTDPGRDTTELPNTITDASNQISQTCSASTQQNKLILAGRGGLPVNANDPLTSDVVWQDPRASASQPTVSNAPTNQLPPPAVGMVFDGKGKVTLVAANTSGRQTGTQISCPQARGQ